MQLNAANNQVLSADDDFSHFIISPSILRLNVTVHRREKKNIFHFISYFWIFFDVKVSLSKINLEESEI